MQRRALLAGGVAWTAFAGGALAEAGTVYFEGFLAFDQELTLPPGAKLYVYVQHLIGMQHGDYVIAQEAKEISDSNFPWGFKLAAEYRDVLAYGDELILGARVVSEEHVYFEGLVIGSANDLLKKKQRIEMQYRPRS